MSSKRSFRITIGRKILLIAASFVLPIAVLTYFVASTIQSYVRFAQLEAMGNEYQRPLERLMEGLMAHRAALRAAPSTEREQRLQSLTTEIADGFDRLAAADAAVGADLQFTAEGLGKRGREHVRVETVRGEWNELAQAVSAAGAWSDGLAERYAHLIGDLRTMIAHGGDTSNLILDPDLDSYYMMDCTLLALPQTQDRIAQILEFVQDRRQAGGFAPQDRVQLAVYAAQLSESDHDRVVASTNTALSEDANFYGALASLQANVPPSLEAYSGTSTAFAEALRAAAASEEPFSDWQALLSTGTEALAASFAYWDVAVAELDRMLDVRIAKYEGDRAWALGLSAAALVVASVLSFWMARTITRPIGRCSSVLQAMAAGRFDQELAVDSADEVGDMARSLKTTVGVLRDVLAQTHRLIDHVRNGQLGERASAERFQGTYGELCVGINQMLDAIVVPIRDCSSALQRIAGGDLDVELTAQYPGDYAAIQRSLLETVRVLRRLLAETEGLTRAARNGELSVRADAQRFEGSYRELCEGINHMLDAMLNPVREALGVLDEVARRNLTVSVEGQFQGEHAKLKSAVNQAVSEMRGAIGAIVSNSTRLSASTRNLATVSGRMSRNAQTTSQDAMVASGAAEQISSNISSLASATEEMSASIREIARNASSVSSVMNSAVSKASSVQAAMDKLVVSSREIGNVIKLITSVAAQTNLLALNATIEAARAGEAGKGFAVVASEVKHLSDQTGEAAAQIAQQINTIQSDADEAREALSQIISVVQEVNGVSLAIAAAVEEQTQTTNEISGSVNEVARGSSDIASSINRVASAAGETTGDVRQAEQAAAELAQAAERLAELVAQFECEEAGARSLSAVA